MAEHPDEAEPEAPDYYDMRAVLDRQLHLMTKRHSPKGLSQEEATELLAVNLQALDMRIRWDRQR